MEDTHNRRTDQQVRWDADLIGELARTLHDHYRTITDHGATADWAELSDSMRTSNLDHAEHIQVKLAAIGCFVELDEPPASTGFELTSEEVEHLAEMEHDRWVRERIRSGWRPGPRQPVNKTTPYLVGWDDLTEEIRELDRMFVRQIPIVLKKLGLQVVRRHGT